MTGTMDKIKAKVGDMVNKNSGNSGNGTSHFAHVL